MTRRPIADRHGTSVLRVVELDDATPSYRPPWQYSITAYIVGIPGDRCILPVTPGQVTFALPRPPEDLASKMNIGRVHCLPGQPAIVTCHWQGGNYSSKDHDHGSGRDAARMGQTPSRIHDCRRRI